MLGFSPLSSEPLSEVTTEGGVTGTVSAALNSFTSTASGTVASTNTITGSVDATFPAMTSEASGTVLGWIEGGTLNPIDVANIVNGVFSRIVENGETFEQQLRLGGYFQPQLQLTHLRSKGKPHSW